MRNDIREKLHRVGEWMKKTRGPMRVAVTVAMASLAAYLVSVLAAFPIRQLLERAATSPSTMSRLSLTVLAALALDLHKTVALVAVGFAFGRFMAVRPWPAAIGLTAGVYLFDAALSYVMGVFRLEWGHGYALAGRLPLMLVTVLVTGFVASWGRRLSTRRESEASTGQRPAGDT